MIKNYKNGKSKIVFDAYLKKFGTGDVSLLKVPARINLLGTHVEHRGGYVNYLTIDKELWCASGKRNDRKIVACNIEEKYALGEFEIDSELPKKNIEWLDFIRKVKLPPGAWLNYIKASVLYLQNKFPEISLKGMNLCFYGEIPVGGGLSSSSAVVVAAMLSACKINNLDIKKENLAEMCGEAEWYVGTRGGGGDHAAMIFGKENQIAHLRFFPFQIEYLPFPAEYSIICCNSLVEAKKSSMAKSAFNERIACYEIGFEMIKKKFPELADKLTYLRDVNTENLGSEEIIYKILLSLPESLTRKEIHEILPEKEDVITTIFETHSEPEQGYKIRDVVMYGIAECARSKKCAYFLKNGDIDKFGQLMFISHDGDRRNFSITNEYLETLIQNLGSSELETKEKARIYNQPGAYGCSTPELDFIVDMAKNIPGVKGAKLTGAGLGGCVLILVQKEYAEETLEILNTKYYRARNLPEAAFICKPTNGAEFIGGWNGSKNIY